MPILAVVGEHDWAVPPVQARHYESAHQGAVREIPDCGHFVQVEKPEDYQEAVLGWLDDPLHMGEDLSG
jgi:pimeloyl-ACP methyl ester carboxylesterase